MSVHTDPGWCYEHKSYMWACATQRHGDETEAERKARVAVLQHPECPDCRCSSALTPWMVRW